MNPVTTTAKSSLEIIEQWGIRGLMMLGILVLGGVVIYLYKKIESERKEHNAFKDQVFNNFMAIVNRSQAVESSLQHSLEHVTKELEEAKRERAENHSDTRRDPS